MENSSRSLSRTISQKSSWLGAGLPKLIQYQIMKCLQEKNDLFVWSTKYIFRYKSWGGLPPIGLMLNALFVAQHHHKQPLEETEETRRVVKYFLKVGFITEAKFSTLLFNVILLKKSNNKWCMCVNYSYLNRVCPKGAHSLPNIDNIVDNSSRFKLWLFMDAYLSYN